MTQWFIAVLGIGALIAALFHHCERAERCEQEARCPPGQHARMFTSQYDSACICEPNF